MIRWFLSLSLCLSDLLSVFFVKETTYRGEIFGGQQPVRHGEINSGGLDTFLFRFFFYHDHTKRCCYRSIVVVVLIVFFQRSDGKISTRLTATVRLLLLLKCFLLLRRRSEVSELPREQDVLGFQVSLIT